MINSAEELLSLVYVGILSKHEARLILLAEYPEIDLECDKEPEAPCCDEKPDAKVAYSIEIEPCFDTNKIERVLEILKEK